jgi:NADPH-dependent 2,4-dienoyl-CoA reductase/sulfur reductase-like enzyme/nitrite reductase/ring-hydroxylating ferredoxin subunit
MSGSEEQSAGPDLGQALPMSSVPMGGMLAGHFQGEPVLIARVGENFFAIGGKCTHYGGPLAEGLIDGETVRCPWHHACFNLRNGAAVAAPALNDVASYEIAIENETVRIVGKKATQEIAAASRHQGDSRAPDTVKLQQPSPSQPSSVVIIGAGAAGNACAEMLRRELYCGPVIMLDPDTDAPYDRPNLSKDYLAGSAPEEWLPLHPKEFYEAQAIDVRRGARVKSIDRAGAKVILEDETSLPYGALLIATGASPMHLDVPGGDSIRYLRTLGDCREIITAAGSARSAVVIGASFIGLEVAASLRARGLEVSVVGLEDVPLAKVLGADLGALVKKVHEDKGVKFFLKHSVASIAGNKATLDDGTVLDADFIVAGIGVKPNTALAETAGLTMDKGISVNEYLETSDPRIFAAGDVARFPDAHSTVRIRIEHWMVAERQGQVAARNMLGQKVRFDDVPFFWSAHYDALTIGYTGHAEGWESTTVEGSIEHMDCAVSFMHEGRRAAVATINRDRQALQAEIEMEREVLLLPPSAHRGNVSGAKP